MIEIAPDLLARAWARTPRLQAGFQAVVGARSRARKPGAAAPTHSAAGASERPSGSALARVPTAVDRRRPRVYRVIPIEQFVDSFWVPPRSHAPAPRVAWRGLITEPDSPQLLLAHRNRILNAMAILSEAPAAAALRGRDPTLVPRSLESRVPPGVRLDASPTDLNRAPDKDRSLYDFYRWYFARAKGIEEVWELIQAAEADLRAHARPTNSTTSLPP